MAPALKVECNSKTSALSNHKMQNGHIFKPQEAGEHDISFYHIFIIHYKLTRGHDKKNTSQTTVLKGGKRQLLV